jgi:hypothetical protein
MGKDIKFAVSGRCACAGREIFHVCHARKKCFLERQTGIIPFSEWMLNVI